MKRIYECTSCGYQYDESLGDADSDVEAGVEFEDLPRRWVCPVCYAPKSDFELVKDEFEEEI